MAALVLGSLALRATVAARCDLYQDEALHWWETRQPGVNFSPQPPVASQTAHVALAVLGHGTLALRAGSLLYGTGIVVLAYLVGRDMFGRRAGLWAAAIVVCCPLLSCIGAVTGPDAPLVFCWLLVVWTGWRAASGSGAWWWAACGLALAVGLYSKYMMALAVPSAFLALVGTRKGRAVLRRPGPWAALALGVVLFAPVFLAWNASYGWPAFAYHLGARHEWELKAKHPVQYLLAHAGAYSPLLWVGILVGLVAGCRAWRRGELRGAWLAAFGGLPILFFLAPSVLTARSMIRVQWDEMGYATGAVALAATLSSEGFRRPAGRAWRRFAAAGLALGALVGLVVWTGCVFPSVPM
ncbi:MAG: glycosyltransferase family 39 protein, partial [Planctomycetota bacterium]